MNRFLKIARLLSIPLSSLFDFIRWLMRNKKHRRWVLSGSILTVLVTGVAAELTLEPRHLPWHRLEIDDRAGFSTGLKLAAIGLGPVSWCERLVARSGTLSVTPLKSLSDSGGCGWSTALHIASSGEAILKGKPPYAMQCPLAAGAHIWMTSVDYRASEILGSGLARIHHAGTYSCRRMYNRSSGPMSEHAYANAWDVTGFELADGRIVSVEKHWRASGPLRTFLRAARDDACDIFRVVLSPEFNAQHGDHLHVDMGNGSRCK